MKFFKKIFNLPVTLFYILIGLLLSRAQVDGKPITISEWFTIMVAVYIVFVIPAEIAIYFLKRFFKFFAKYIDIKKQKLKNTIEENENALEPSEKEDFIPEAENENDQKENIVQDVDRNAPESKGANQNQEKNSNEKDVFLSSLTYDGVTQKLKQVDELMEIITSTTDKKEFVLSMNELSQILYLLSQVEDLFDFTILPSKMLEDLQENRSLYIDLLENRIGSSVDNMDGHDFEEFCADLLRKDGYENVEVTPGSGDQGIDIIAYKHKVKYGIQCKRYASDIGNKAVQEAYAGAKYYDCHVPVVLTNQHFTESAIDLAGKTNVLLWDRGELNRLMEKIKV